MWKSFIKVFVLLFFPLLLFSLLWSYQQKQDLIENMVLMQQRDMNKKSFHLTNKVGQVAEATGVWSDYVSPSNFISDFELDDNFISNFIKSIELLENYIQFKLIDLQGRVIVRYDKTGKNTMVRSNGQQNILHRSYFQKGLRLQKGQIHISPIERNTELELGETPQQPVIHGVTPIFEKDGSKVGLAVLTFSMEQRLRLMKTGLVNENFYLMDKYQNVITTNLSDNLVPHKNEMNISDSIILEKLPSKNIIYEKDTFFIENESLWLYKYVALNDINLNSDNQTENMYNVIFDDNWTIVQELPPSYIGNRLKNVKKYLIVFNVFTAMVIGLAAFLYAKLQRDRTNFIDKLKSKNIALKKRKDKLKSTNDQMTRLNNRLEVRNHQLKGFNYVVAHNLKAPVTSLSIMVDMLKKSEDVETFKELLPNLEKVSTSIATLTDDVQSYVSILSTENIKLENVNLLQLLQEVENDFVETLLDKHHDFQTIYKFDEWDTLRCSQFYMKSILHNFLSNAIKYRKKGIRSHVIFETAWENEKKVLYIKDNGLGIDLDRHGENMFKLYKRFHRNISGKGMGLFIIKSQLEAMHASIEVESQQNVGTTFIIKFSKF